MESGEEVMEGLLRVLGLTGAQRRCNQSLQASPR